MIHHNFFISVGHHWLKNAIVKKITFSYYLIYKYNSQKNTT